MNKVILSGRLASDKFVETRTSKGYALKFLLAVVENKTEFIEIVCFNSVANVFKRKFNINDFLEITGYITVNEFSKKNEKFLKNEIIATEIIYSEKAWEVRQSKINSARIKIQRAKTFVEKVIEKATFVLKNDEYFLIKKSANELIKASSRIDNLRISDEQVKKVLADSLLKIQKLKLDVEILKSKLETKIIEIRAQSKKDEKNFLEEIQKDDFGQNNWGKKYEDEKE